MNLKLVVILLVLISIVGCTRIQEPLVEQPVDKAVVDTSQKAPVKEPAVKEPAVKEPAVKEPETNETGIIYVNLTGDKQMHPNRLDVKKGTTVRFTNKDTKFNHQLLIHFSDVKVASNDDILGRSVNIAPGDYWEYTFEESRAYTVKDIYSGTMRGEITAKVTGKTLSEEINDATDIGTVNVR